MTVDLFEEKNIGQVCITPPFNTTGGGKQSESSL